jgi:hypothetical protein
MSVLPTLAKLAEGVEKARRARFAPQPGMIEQQ